MMDRGHFYSDGAEKSNGAKEFRGFAFNDLILPLSRVCFCAASFLPEWSSVLEI
jgi:hypothetical protein